MPPYQYKSTEASAPEPLHYVRLLEPQAIVEYGKQPAGAVLRVPESTAIRYVEHTGIAESATKEDYEEWQDYKQEQAEARAAATGRGQFNSVGGRAMNIQQLNANMAALGNNPSQFDPSALPLKEDVDPRLRRRAPVRRVPPSSGRTLEDLSNETVEPQTPVKGASSKQTAKPGAPLPDDGDDGDE